MPLPLPTRLGRYAVRRRIGSGGFATVWLAYDEQLDSPVAVKVLGDIWTEDHQIRRRFVEEGRYLRKVESPHVVAVYDAGELDDGRPYLVMSYADQGTLADRLVAADLTPAQAVRVVRETGAGLQALHDRGIVHRDVKPANVLFRSVEGPADGPGGPRVQVRAMVGDLGLGKALDGSSRLTMIAGTPSFVAPEQAAAESPGPAADQYSLAAVAYLLLTGRRPFERSSIIDATRPEALDPVGTPERPFPEAVEAVLGRGLSFDPADRYPSVTAFVADLAAALAPLLDDAGPDVLPDRSASTSGLPVDPDLTQPGPRPSLPVGGTPVGSAPAEAAPVDPAAAADGSRPPGQGPRRRRRALLVGVPLGLLALAAGGGAGFAAQESRHPQVTVLSDGGVLSVTVPQAWARARATHDWRPPGAAQDYDALSIGTSPAWTAVDSHQQGVFLGLLPGRSLPATLPQHPECRTARPTSRTGSGNLAAVTAVYQDCPGGVTVERVVRVTNEELLWVQVRSAQQSTAADVLDSVRTPGL